MGREIGFLNGLRALAALYVLTAHCAIWAAWRPPFLIDPEVAVDLFMILSGLLMVHTVSTRADREPPNRAATWAAFFVRRAFRIAPLYYLALAGVLLVGTWLRDGLSLLYHQAGWTDPAGDPAGLLVGPRNMLAHLSFIFGLVPRLAKSTGLPDWSLSLEMQFYAAFPLLFLAFRRFGPLTASAALFVVSLAVTSALAGVYPVGSFLPLKLPYFLAGMLLYGVAAPGVAPARLLRVGLATGMVVVFAALRYPQSAAVVVEVGIVLGIAAMLAPEMGSLPAVRLVERWLSGRAATMGADVSYGVYLFHNFLIAAVALAVLSRPEVASLRPAIRAALLWLLVAPLTFAVATLLHRVVERPGIGAGRQILKSRRLALA